MHSLEDGDTFKNTHVALAFIAYEDAPEDEKEEYASVIQITSLTNARTLLVLVLITFHFSNA